MNNAELIFERLKKSRYTEIQRMINEQQEESDFLDFKLKSDPAGDTISKDDKRNYVKALSGFANTSGGVIIWGVDASKNKDGLDAAKGETPIINAKIFQTTLNSLLSNALIPLLPDIENMFIPIPGTDDGFVVTYVPASDLPPHQALLGENKYYMRIGDSFTQMTHHHISEAFGRRQKPVLEVHYEIQSGAIIGTGPDSEFECSIVVGIRNIGRYVATYPAIRIKAGENLRLLERANTQGLPLIYQTKIDIQKNGYMFAGGINDVVHPGSYKSVYPLYITTKIKEQHLYGDETVMDDLIFSFSYELFAERCQPVKDEVIIKFDEIKQALLFS
ncbi:TPA: ATP-binding protein [Bacillus cereus]|uniref:AlbA family DNA-binding domain-containing protein n=1 Tax=Bacillus TaxID=1386 RepID=UPI0008FE2B04|nr:MULTISPECIES: ATP-binding protein [Bacillus cereus group]MCU5489922.1 ATP-binding protein [Bacillus cereus]MDF9466953.1 ATP-binding protein [Bacillus cereus]OJD99313.1 hypothetical protein A9489_27640 [Bacillus thuringiensis]PFA79728.1 ATP-binding protein [Bacillus thuringiensis]QWS00910.1 ATP-binding protein [Bacillus cereus]